MSFMKYKNKIVELGSPCFTPMLELKNDDMSELNLTAALTVLYMFLIANTNFELTFSRDNFWNMKNRFNLSKHFSKSTNAQYNFLRLYKDFRIIECKRNMQSIVDNAHEFPGFLTPVLTRLSVQTH